MGAREMDFAQAMEDERDAMMPGIECDVIMFSNTSSGARQKSEGTLLVRRQPHVVRPREDTGVVFDMDESGEVRLELNDPTNPDGYNVDSLQLETPHHLCLACNDALDYYCQFQKAASEGNGKDLVNAVVHHHTIWSLLAFAQTGQCHLCGELWQCLSIKYPRAVEIDNMDQYRTEISWTQGTESDGKHRLFFALTHPNAKRDAWNPFHFYRMDMWPSKGYNDYFTIEDMNDEREERITPEIEASNDCMTSIKLAHAWLFRCLSNVDDKHNECHASPDAFYKLPSRLLDVDAAFESGKLKLVSTSDSEHDFEEKSSFITLSHSWGAWGAQHSPKLTCANIEERMIQGLDLRQVPRTFTEAIRIANWFEVKWIWIDCLCIIQDSLEDWLLEASMMADNYKNAFLNISADAHEDARKGCFVERDPNDVLPLKLRATGLDKSWYVTPTSGYFFGWMHDAPSFSRAWIHRERQLSKRILHFTGTQMMWECCGVDSAGFACETFPGGAPFEETYAGENKFQVTALQNGQVADEEVYQTWNDLCENFSRKSLSKPTDMPVVLSSLAADFQALLPSDEYIAGLWKSTLPSSLLWDSLSPERGTDEYIAPSWSWLSTAAPLQLNHRKLPRRWKASDILIIEDIDICPKHPDISYGPVSSGRLTVTGYLRSVHLSFGSESFALSVYDNSQRLRKIGHSWDEYVGDKCKIRLDDYLDSEELDCFCLFVRMKQWKDHNCERNIACLLLQKTSTGEFQRLGTLDLGDEFALKMRYRVKETGCTVDSGEVEVKWEQLRAEIATEQSSRMQREQDEADQREKEKKNDAKAQGALPKKDSSRGFYEPPVKRETSQRQVGRSDPALLYQYDGEECLSWLERLIPETITLI